MPKQPTENDSSNDSELSRWSDPDKCIKRAKDTEKVFKRQFWKAAEAAWEEYELGESDSAEGASEAGTGAKVQLAKRFPIFWSSIKTLAPAYYSKTPIPIAPVRYGITDPDARTGSKLLERLGIYSLETLPFDAVMRETTIEYILSDVATVRVMLEGDRKKEQIPIQRNPQNPEEYLLPDGQPYTGDMIGQGESGAYYGERDYWENLKCYPMSLSYDEVMWTPEAGSEDEIDEMFFRFCYAEDEAYEMFPEIEEETLKAAMRAYARKDGEDKYQKSEHDGPKELFLHGWEIWCKKDRKIRFISPDLKGEFLKESEDTYKLRKFFPAPCPIIGTKQRKTLFGVPGYRYVSPLIDQMHEAAQRVYCLAQALRPRFVVDAEYKSDLTDLIQSADESEYIFIKKLADIVEKGGLGAVIQALPVGEFANALMQVSQLFEVYKQQFYEIYGVPDVVRGMSDPLETAKAQEIKSFSATNRFRDQMNQIAGIARELLELLVDLKLGAYPQEQIFKICGAQFLDPADQQRLPQAYALITNDAERLIRLDLETDSTSYINEQIEQANRNLAIQTVTNGIKALQGLPPPAQAIGFKTILAALSGLRMGKDFMDDIESLMQQMLEAANKPQEPPPDVEMLKVRQKGQEIEIKAMTEQQKLEQRDREALIDAQAKQHEMWQKDQGLILQKQKLDLDVWNQQQMRNFDAIRIQLEEMSAGVSAQIETALVRIREFEARMNATESAMEEVRLAQDTKLETARTIGEMVKPQAEPGENSSPVNVNVITPKI